MIKTLQYIAEHYGNDVLRDGNKLLAYYTDLAPQQKTERKMLEFLVQCNGNAILLDIAHQTQQEQQVCVETLVKQLTSQLLMSEDAAYTACNNYLQAIGANLEQRDSPRQPKVSVTTVDAPINAYSQESKSVQFSTNKITLLAILLALTFIIIFAFSSGIEDNSPSTAGDNSTVITSVDIYKPNDITESATEIQVEDIYQNDTTEVDINAEETENVSQQQVTYTGSESIGLGSMNPCSGPNLSTNEYKEDIYGNTFAKGLEFYHSAWSSGTEESTEYVVNNKYVQFTATIMVHALRDDFEANLKIYADNKLVYDSGSLTKKSEPINISLDISDIKFIRFDTYRTEGAGSILLSNPLLENDENMIENGGSEKAHEPISSNHTGSNHISLGSIDPCSGPNLSTNEYIEDIYGNTFSKGLKFYHSAWSSGTEESTEYAVNSKYVQITATIMVHALRDDFEANLKIYVDNILVFDSGSLTKKSEPINISVDITKAKFIRFDTYRIDGAGSILLSNPLLE